MAFFLLHATVTSPQDKATLYYFNTSGRTLFAGKQALLDNDQKIAALDRDHYIVLTIAPGHHVLRLKDERSTVASKRHQVDLSVVAGVTYYIAGGYHPRMPAVMSTWSFEEIPKEEADKLLTEMKPQGEK